MNKTSTLQNKRSKVNCIVVVSSTAKIENYPKNTKFDPNAKKFGSRKLF